MSPPARLFVLLTVVAVPLIAYQGRHQWFYFDDWYFLDPITSLRPSVAMEPYWGHWTIVPRLIHGALFSAFGLRHYWPYQVPVVAAHVAVAVLLRLVMVRARVDPWIATALATAFLLFGPGRDNMVWAFQISMTGSLAFGLAQLLLADHDGPIDRRSVVAALAGVVAVGSSNLGVVVLVATGTSLAWRRGFRVAAVQVVPPALAFGGWWAAYGRHVPMPVDLTADSPAQAVDYAVNLCRVFVAELGPGPTGPILAALVVLGGALAVRAVAQGEPERWAAPLGLLAAGVVFVVTTALSRAGGQALGALAPEAAPSRYLHVLAVFCLPIIGVACTELGRLTRSAPAVAVIVWFVVLAGLPASVAAIAEPSGEYALGSPIEVTVVAEVAAAFDEVPSEQGATLAALRSIGWLVDQVESGRMPAAPAGHDEIRGRAFAQIAFEPARPPATPGCTSIERTVPVDLEVGDVIHARGAPASTVTVTTVEGPALRTTFTIGPTGQLAQRVRAGPMRVALVASDPANGRVQRCT